MASQNYITMTYQCGYSEYGCRAILSSTQKAIHETTCQFGSCLCPLIACPCLGTFSGVSSHMNRHHPEIASATGEELVLSATNVHDFPGDHIGWMMIQHCHGKCFMILMAKIPAGDQDQFYVTVQLFGSRGHCKNYTCRLELKGCDGMKYVWVGNPTPIEDGIPSPDNPLECFLFGSEIARFCTVNGTLPVVVSIRDESNDGVVFHVTRFTTFDPSGKEPVSSALQQFYPD
ncbi:unnamed protein product [Orchesella dallaii]|uniref:E3 ubiquitin-protein ligase n=1 Tax=Orchesella dallaii TaxID=48710 RepID=A0ABP1QKA4_9HEXA